MSPKKKFKRETKDAKNWAQSAKETVQDKAKDAKDWARETKDSIQEKTGEMKKEMDSPQQRRESLLECSNKAAETGGKMLKDVEKAKTLTSDDSKQAHQDNNEEHLSEAKDQGSSFFQAALGVAAGAAMGVKDATVFAVQKTADVLGINGNGDSDDTTSKDDKEPFEHSAPVTDTDFPLDVHADTDPEKSSLYDLVSGAAQGVKDVVHKTASVLGLTTETDQDSESKDDEESEKSDKKEMKDKSNNDYPKKEFLKADKPHESHPKDKGDWKSDSSKNYSKEDKPSLPSPKERAVKDKSLPDSKPVHDKAHDKHTKLETMKPTPDKPSSKQTNKRQPPLTGKDENMPPIPKASSDPAGDCNATHNKSNTPKPTEKPHKEEVTKKPKADTRDGPKEGKVIHPSDEARHLSSSIGGPGVSQKSERASTRLTRSENRPSDYGGLSQKTTHLGSTAGHPIYEASGQSNISSLNYKLTETDETPLSRESYPWHDTSFASGDLSKATVLGGPDQASSFSLSTHGAPGSFGHGSKAMGSARDQEATYHHQVELSPVDYESDPKSSMREGNEDFPATTPQQNH